MKLMRLGWAELIGLGGSAVLLTSVFLLPWFETAKRNRFSDINGLRTTQDGPITALDAYGGFEWVLVAACAAPVILALIVIVGAELTWDRGEVTAIVGITAFVLLLYKGGVIGPVPDNAVEVSLAIGFYVALVAAAAIFAAGVLRLGERGVENKPPGV